MLKPAITVSPRLLLHYISTVLVNIFLIDLLDLQMIRNVAKGERYWDLEEETNGSHGITGESRETKAVDN